MKLFTENEERSWLSMLGMMVVMMLLCGILGLLLYNAGWLSLFGILMAFPAERWIRRWLVKRKREKVRGQFGDFLLCAASGFATGRHMTEILEEADSELAHLYEEGEPIRRELSLVRQRIKEDGWSDLSALQEFEQRVSIEEITDFVDIYGILRQTGGDLVRAMNHCATVLQERIQIEQEIQSMVVQKKFEGRMITAMPLLMLLLLRLAAPDYLGVLYDSLEGRFLMTIALAVTLYSYRLIERITDIHV